MRASMEAMPSKLSMSAAASSLLFGEKPPFSKLSKVIVCAGYGMSYRPHFKSLVGSSSLLSVSEPSELLTLANFDFIARDAPPNTCLRLGNLSLHDDEDSYVSVDPLDTYVGDVSS